MIHTVIHYSFNKEICSSVVRELLRVEGRYEGMGRLLGFGLHNVKFTMNQ